MSWTVSCVVPDAESVAREVQRKALEALEPTEPAPGVVESIVIGAAACGAIAKSGAGGEPPFTVTASGHASQGTEGSWCGCSVAGRGKTPR